MQSGIRAVIEAINAGTTISKVYLQKGLTGYLFSELKTIIKANSYVPVETLNRLSKNSNHKDLAAQLSPIKFVVLETPISDTVEKTATPLFLLLTQLSYGPNFVTIIRTAEFTGVNIQV